MLGFYTNIPLPFYCKAKAFVEAIKVEDQGYGATGALVVNTDAEDAENNYSFMNRRFVNEQTNVRPDLQS